VGSLHLTNLSDVWRFRGHS